MKTILITGARSGIISEVIDKIKYDYNIYVTVHTEGELIKVREKYDIYDNIRCFKLDLLKSDYKNIYADILICNGAIMESGSLIEIPFKNIRENFEVNFFGNIRLIRQVFKKNPNVRIIAISSLASRIPIPFCGAYCSSKAALSMMLETMNAEMKIGNKKTRVIIVEPGLYQTGFNEYGVMKKYDFMDIDTFFKEQLELIKSSENLILKLFQKKNYKSISNKIIKAIEKENPKLYYRAPFFQSLFVKMYNFFQKK